MTPRFLENAPLSRTAARLAAATSALALALTTLALAAPPALAQTPIKAAPGGNWAGGYLVGRPQKNSIKGMLYKSMEMQVNMGGFGGNRYLGTTFDISTTQKEIYEQFQKLDPNQNYVFQYRYPHPLMIIGQKTHHLVTRIIPMKTGFASSGLPREVKGLNGTQRGRYSAGKRIGVIEDVYRWGGGIPTLHKVCNVTINVGGHSGGEGGGESKMTFLVRGEENCAYAEAIMPYGLEIEVEYSQFYMNWREGEDYLAHAIRVIGELPAPATLQDPSAAGASAAQPAAPAPAAGLTYEEYKRRLLQDEQFMKEIRRLIEEEEKAKAQKGH